jgi:hypothetical protein
VLHSGRDPALPANIRLGWKGLAGTNTSLLRKSVNYDRKKFYSTGPRDRKLTGESLKVVLAKFSTMS